MALLPVVAAEVGVPVVVDAMLVAQRQRLLKNSMQRWWTTLTPTLSTVLPLPEPTPLLAELCSLLLQMVVRILAWMRSL